MVKSYKLYIISFGILLSALLTSARISPYAWFNKGETSTKQNVSSKQQFINFTIYPNPVTTQTTISYVLAAKCKVVLKVIDLTGRQLAVLVQQEQAAGKQQYSWQLSKNNITSGVYILVLQVNGVNHTKKIVVYS